MDPAHHYDKATLERMAEKACHAARRALHKKERAKGRGLSNVFFKLRRALPDITDPDTADHVLKRVMDNCPSPWCAWMVAVIYERVDSLFRLDNNLAIKSMEMDFVKEVVEHLGLSKSWAPISAIYDHYPHVVLFKSHVRRWLINYSLEDDPAGVELLGKVMRHADMWDPEDLANVVGRVVHIGGVEQFRELINSPGPAARKEVAASLESLLIKICTERIMRGVGSPRSARLGICFMAAAQAGLFAAAVDTATAAKYMVMAATANQPDLVLCLHHCGTLSSRDYSAMLELEEVKAIGSEDPARLWEDRLLHGFNTAPFDEEAKETALGIKRFLMEQASTPSSLKKMCLQRLSRQVGWGHGREERIRELDVLEGMRDDLRFKGLEQVLRKK